jgi:hypothetical protein
MKAQQGNVATAPHEDSDVNLDAQRAPVGAPRRGAQ